MKRFLLIIIGLVIILFLFFYKKDNEELKSSEIRAVFISYIDYNGIKSKEDVKDMVKNISSHKFNTIILQVRAFGDAIYKSKYFPFSNKIKSDFDVLKYFIKYSKEKDIKIYAWVNPYRISFDKDFVISSSLYYHDLIFNGGIRRCSKGVYFNPASDKALDLIIKGIEEIVKIYDVDGIIYDDYFYPSDDIDYEETKYLTDKSEFRYERIKKLIKRTYEVIKSINKNVVFGISPSGNNENNLRKEYLDINRVKDYLDFLMPQLYYGFDNKSKPFLKTLYEWEDFGISMIPALSLYKSGKEDAFSQDGIYEWKENADILKREIEASRKTYNYMGFAIFRYNNLINPENENMKKEVDNLIKLLK